MTDKIRDAVQHLVVDALTAADLVRSGHRSKALSDRLSQHCSVLSKMLAAPAAPVAQEPVAFYWKDVGVPAQKHGPYFGWPTADVLERAGKDVVPVPLYAAPPAAEQPASTTSDRYRAELYDEIWERARSMGYGNVTMALAELERLKAAEHPTRAMQALATISRMARNEACRSGAPSAGQLCTWDAIADMADAALAESPAAEQPACPGCNGHGLVGGFVSAESGYDAEECPFCCGDGFIHGTECGACDKQPDTGHELFAELYQILGDMGASEAVLDQVLAASQGEPLPHASLLPYAAGQSDTVAVPRELLAEAESIIDSYAEALKASRAPGGDWEGEEAAQDDYEREARVASRLRRLLAGGAE